MTNLHCTIHTTRPGGETEELLHDVMQYDTVTYATLIKLLKEYTEEYVHRVYPFSEWINSTEEEGLVANTYKISNVFGEVRYMSVCIQAEIV